ncbi:DUF4920 domain-containing protein [Pleomorphovibrio marinus]|uniref:DUF4920 domain-containing protein n=1 Tax=Pleomorphovibrio marinus TaxID=2164132 RepID=UPI000E0C6B76|nr:DUF4920 domain-containing protein [Pleomorphovibrio marinus]
MKKLVPFMLGVLMMASCGSPSSVGEDKAIAENEESPQVPGNYGDKITEEKAVSVAEMYQKVNNEGAFKGKVRGEIKEVCTHKGCWLGLSLPDGSVMRVTFKDYGFFVPTESTGFPVVIEGEATKTVTDVATLRHYAEDAGKSKEEIEAIDSPEENVTFVADGVIILNKS